MLKSFDSIDEDCFYESCGEQALVTSFLAAPPPCIKCEITKNKSLGRAFRTEKGQSSLYWYIFTASAGAFIICSSRSGFVCTCAADALSFYGPGMHLTLKTLLP